MIVVVVVEQEAQEAEVIMMIIISTLYPVVIRMPLVRLCAVLDAHDCDEA
jgi:hypothetical protein